MNKFIISNDLCELCMSEYISIQSDERLKHIPNNQNKTEEAYKIIMESIKIPSKPCIKYSCRELPFTSHNICVDHLYKMIDAIKEYEEEF